MVVAGFIQPTKVLCPLSRFYPITGKNYDHRKQWIEKYLEHHAKYFGIDLLCFSLLSNHFHLILRSQPEIVKHWTNREVAQRWLMLCPKRKQRDGSPAEPKETEINPAPVAIAAATMAF